MLIVSAIGCLCAIFIATLFFRNPQPSTFANRLMGLLFLLIAIRLGKVLAQSSELEVLQSVYFNLMHAAFLAMGPVLLFFIRTHLQQGNWKPLWLLHLFPAFIIVLTASLIRNQASVELWLRTYEFILLYPVAYLLLAGKAIAKNPTSSWRSWTVKSLSLVALIWGMNGLYYWFNFPFYWVTGILVACIFYFLLLSIKPVFPFSTKKYKNLQLSPAQCHDIFRQLDKAVIGEKLYMDADLRLDRLSDHLGISLHVLSGAVNSVTGMGFPQYLHEARITAAQSIMKDHPSLKIAAVAYEVGYRSLSTFNTAFKNKTHLTPSQFKTQTVSKKYV